jgi:hypothetical protein
MSSTPPGDLCIISLAVPVLFFHGTSIWLLISLFCFSLFPECAYISILSLLCHHFTYIFTFTWFPMP